ncbi:MAG: hypothetical protein IJU19_00170 [Bacteroidales bacterium]|nr:hypothetical protein [Bacteroidales bacterium]
MVEEIPVEVETERVVEVAKPLGWWQKTLMWAGGIGLLALAAALAWKTRGWWIKLFIK